MGRKREESGSQLHEDRMKPYHIYFEGNAGLLARDYAKFPNKVLWKLAEKVREVVSAGKVVRIEDSVGTNLTATYDGKRLYGMQFRAGDPPGRCHFPWGRCGVFNGDGEANGEVLSKLCARRRRHVGRTDALESERQLDHRGGWRRRSRRRVQAFVQRSSRIESPHRDHVRLPSESVGATWHRRSHALGVNQQDALGRLGNAAQTPDL